MKTFEDEPFPIEYDEDDWPIGPPHDLKTSTMTGDIHCKLCGFFYPEEPCEAPMVSFTSDNDTEWVAVFAREHQRAEGKDRITVRFYDRRQAGKPGFNGVLGQYVAEYDPDTIISVSEDGHGLALYGSVADWSIDAETIGRLSDWVLTCHEDRKD